MIEGKKCLITIESARDRGQEFFSRDAKTIAIPDSRLFIVIKDKDDRGQEVFS